jgi:alkylation response protein AidB-like acyl-CoA dehydrogenase
VASLWSGALAAGRIAVAHQMVAGARAMLSMALDYAQARKQFGTPIGTFQAVKHRLAETLVVISSADAAALAAASNGNATAALTAKVLAGRAAATAARNCLQVFGGVGFTTEHAFHRYLRRNLVLDRLLGDARTLQIELGTQLRTGALAGDRLVNLEDPLRIALLA